MQITNELIHDFINCRYKAYRKISQDKGNPTEYEVLSSQLVQRQKDKFENNCSENKMLLGTGGIFKNVSPKDGTLVNHRFNNANVDLLVDAVEMSRKSIIPVHITPFEKVTKSDKLFVALQAALIKTGFNIKIEYCRVIYGEGLNKVKFRLATLAKLADKTIKELHKMLADQNAPAFFRCPHCQVCEFQPSCHNRLFERDDLSLLAGLKPKEILQKNSRGIFSVKQLSYTFKPRKLPYRKRAFLPELKALAIREGKTFIQEAPVLRPVETEVFLDFEGIPDRNFYYLTGVIIKTGNAETSYSFWADDKTEQMGMFIKLANIIQPLTNFTIYHFGSYETQALKSISKNLPVEYQNTLKTMADNSFNLLDVFNSNIYPPTYSNGLKEIARFLKFDWTDKEASGFQSMVWRYNWELTQNEYLKSKLITYNLEDCQALVKLTQWIRSIPKSGDERFEKTDKFKKQSIYKLGRVDFALKEFEKLMGSLILITNAKKY